MFWQICETIDLGKVYQASDLGKKRQGCHAAPLWAKYSNIISLPKTCNLWVLQPYTCYVKLHSVFGIDRKKVNKAWILPISNKNPPLRGLTWLLSKYCKTWKVSRGFGQGGLQKFWISIVIYVHLTILLEQCSIGLTYRVQEGQFLWPVTYNELHFNMNDHLIVYLCQSER